MEINNWEILEDAFRKGKDFATFRLPHSDIIQFLIGEHSRQFQAIGQLELEKGFVAAPFSISPTHPILLIEGPLQTIPAKDVSFPDFPPCQTEETEEDPQMKSAYLEKFHTFKSAIDDGNFHKLVLSRTSRRDLPPAFSPLDIFLRACRKYQDSFIYLYRTAATGMWMGCTPEIILEGKENEWKTVALAGTVQSEQGEIEWDSKNKEEQAYVATYIRNILQQEADKVCEDGPHTAVAGKLKHLKTEFQFQTATPSQIFNILEALHPTPAVCGLPKEAAFRFIQEQEGYDRGWYSGFTGYLDQNSGTHLFVNLRCMEILSDHLTLYAGGGLVSGSEPEKEWMETINKMGTVGSLIR